MPAVDTGVDDRPPNFVATHVEQRACRITLDRGYGLRQCRHRLTVTRYLPYLRIRRELVVQNLLEQRVPFVGDDFGPRALLRQATYTFGIIRFFLVLPAGPQDDARQRHIAIQGAEIAERGRAFRLCIRVAGTRPAHDGIYARTQFFARISLDLALNLAFLPPLRERHHDAQHFTKKMPRRNESVQIRDMRILSGFARQRQCVDALGHQYGYRACGLPAMRCDQQVHARAGICGVCGPHVAQHGRILQLAPVVGGAQQHEFNQCT